MAENLKTTHYNNGDEILTAPSYEDWCNLGWLGYGGYGDYDNNPTNSETYGRLYNWPAAMDDRGVCPEGYHIPSDDEWTILTDYLGGVVNEYGDLTGGKMKEVGHEHWNYFSDEVSEAATNKSGFTGLPAGNMGYGLGDHYDYLGEMGFFWSSTESSTSMAWHRCLQYNFSHVTRNSREFEAGLSIRCLQDDTTTGCTDPEATNYNPDATVDDGSCCIELWGECYNIETTTGLHLGNSGLTGEIPPEIGQLTNLTYLNLIGNGLTGEIPPEIGNMTNLTDLDLAWNELTGAIPPEIGSLTNLELIYLMDNQLTGSIPPEIGNLTNLYRLALDGNQLTSIPPEIGNMTNLGELYIYGNQLTGEIPAEIGNLTNLTILYLGHNQLSGQIPVEICAQGINSLELAYNQLCPPYPECISENGIGYQDTSECPVYGCTDPEATNYNELADTDDGSCCVELWGECYNIEETTYLDLSSSGLTGEIPSSIGELTSLTYLNLSSNQLTGEIPSIIGNLTNLTHLDLHHIHFTGSIPSEIGNLTNLTYLNLQSGSSAFQLTGEIPSEIWTLTNLTDLLLFANLLTGEIPSDIGNLTNLTILELCWNNLTGEIPPEIGNLTNLSYLCLFDNQLTGLLPPEICIIGDCDILLFNNQLCPPYPECIYNYDWSGQLSSEFQDTSECPVFGCTDPEACNYNPDATQDDGSCDDYPDCAGECGGGTELDECGVCGGDGIAGNSCDGLITLFHEDSYNFFTEEIGHLSGGDLYFGFYYNGSPDTLLGIPQFWTNNGGQNGLIDLGDLGTIPLSQVEPPSSGYIDNWGIDGIIDHIYVNIAHDGEDGFIIFRVLDIIYNSSVSLSYYILEDECEVALGDVNGDGDINIFDLVQIAYYILDLSIPDYECAADYNQDGSVDILDLVEIVNIILFEE